LQNTRVPIDGIGTLAREMYGRHRHDYRQVALLGVEDLEQEIRCRLLENQDLVLRFGEHGAARRVADHIARAGRKRRNEVAW